MQLARQNARCSMVRGLRRQRVRLRLRLQLRCITQRQELLLLLLLHVLQYWLSAEKAVALGIALKDDGSAHRGHIVAKGRYLRPVREPELCSRLAFREPSTATEHSPYIEHRSRTRSTRWRRVERILAFSSGSTDLECTTRYGEIPVEELLRTTELALTDRRVAGGQGSGARSTTAFVVPTTWPLTRRAKEGAQHSTQAYTCGIGWRGEATSVSWISPKKAPSRLLLFQLEFNGLGSNRVASGRGGESWRRPKHRRDGGFGRDACGRGNDRFELDARTVSRADEGDRVDEGTLPRPMLITIGPQCSGKTTLLRDLGSSDAANFRVTDVAIDDHPSVFFKISIDMLLDGCEPGSDEDVTVGDRPLSSRLRDLGCVEARCVASRLLGRTSAEGFTDGIRRLDGNKASQSALDALCCAVETAISANLGLSTPSVDLFVRENLFPGAISASRRRLAAVTREDHRIVAWGNTNTQARDFRGALEQAESTGRPVRFLRWGYELPRLGLDELSRRNVYRFATTGRYVETAAIETALARVARLYASTDGGDPARLALAAGFRMDASGRVSSLSSNSSSTAAGDNTNTPKTGSGVPATGDPPARAGGDGGVATRGRWSRRWSASPKSRGDHSSSENVDVDIDGRAGGWDGFLQGGMASAGSEVTTPRQRSDLREKSPPLRSGGGSGLRTSASVFTTPDYGYRGDGSGGPTSPQAASPSRSPPVARPMPFRRLAGEIEEGRFGVVGSAGKLGLAQEWSPRGGRRLATYGGGSITASTRARRQAWASPTVMFASEWKKMRGWRRNGYSDDDIDPTMSACYFSKPANSTGALKRFDADGSNADMEEMDLVRRIRDFRQR